MIKVIEVINRRPGMSVEEFQEYWLHRHGPVVAQLPGLRRYVQSHVRPGGYRNRTPAFDGTAELWFDDKAGLAAIVDTPEFEAAKADEPNFIDTATLLEIVVDEHVIKPGHGAGEAPPGTLKNIEFVRFRPDLEAVDGQAYWRDVHGPIAAAIPTMGRYVQSHVRRGAYSRPTPPPFDGVAITWWDDIDAMRASAASDEYRATRADEPNFIGEEPPVILTDEHVVLG